MSTSGSTAKKSKGSSHKAHGNQATGSATLGSQIGAAVLPSANLKVGFKDFRDLEYSYICGTVYVGNGTVGAANQVFFSTNNPTRTIVYSGVASTTGQLCGFVPIAPADGDASTGATGVGSAYTRSLTQYFATQVYKRVILELIPTDPNTNDGMTVIVQPARGCYSIGQTTNGSTAQANGAEACLTAKGSVWAPAWGGCKLDLTPYIAGGFGPKQNEFRINAGNESKQAIIFGLTVNGLSNVVPCCFAIAGANTTTGNQGTDTHWVRITCVVDLLDFIGANADSGNVYGASMPARVREKLGLGPLGGVSPTQTDVKYPASGSLPAAGVSTSVVQSSAKTAGDIEKDTNDALNRLSTAFKSQNEELVAAKRLLTSALNTCSPEMTAFIQDQLAANRALIRSTNESLLAEKARLLSDKKCVAGAIVDLDPEYMKPCLRCLTGHAEAGPASNLCRVCAGVVLSNRSANLPTTGLSPTPK